MPTLQYQVHVTARDGKEAVIVGEQSAINVVTQALEDAGATWNAEVQTWDFGFYSSDVEA